MESQIRFLVESYYDIQKLRIETFNRIVAYVKANMEKFSHLFHENHDEIASHARSEHQVKSASASQNAIETREKSAEAQKETADKSQLQTETHYKGAPKPSVIAHEIVSGKRKPPNEIKELVWYHNSLYETEKGLAKRLDAWSKHHPIRINFLSKVRGIGPVLSSGIIAWLSPISRFPNISKLWAYCYSDDTEVLTEDGFKLFRDVTYNDRIATLNPETGELEYYHPIAIQRIPYEGKMVHFKGRSYDLLVTPEHLMYVRIIKWKRSGSQPQWTFIPAMQLYRHLRKHPHAHIELKRDVIWRGIPLSSFKLPTKGQNKSVESVPIDTWLKFFGWYITEGSCDRHGRQKLPRISIGQKEWGRAEEIASLAREMGFSPYVYSNGGIYRIHITSVQLYDYLKQFGKAKDKFIPKWVKFLPPEHLKTLIKTMMKGDGCESDQRFYTMSKALADDFQEICLKAGYSATVSKGENGIYRVRIITRDATPLITRTPEIVDYRGYVYDVTVPKHHIILVRRNGKICWSSNCGLAPGQKRKRGLKLGYNPRLKTLMWKVAASFEKQKPEKSRYRRLYEEKKKYYLSKREDLKKAIEKGEKGAKLHVRLLAMRFTVKRFLADLWVQWRRLEGLPITKPYAHTVLGHEEYEEWTPDITD